MNKYQATTRIKNPIISYSTPLSHKRQAKSSHNLLFIDIIMKQGLTQTNVFVINAQPGETIPLSVTSTSSSVKFALPQSIANYEVVVTNAGSNTAFVAFGASSAGTVTAQLPGTNGTLNATPVLAGEVSTFQKNSDALKCDTCAAICSSGGSTTLYFTSVQGS